MRDDDERTGLHWAASSKNPELVEYLLSLPAIDINCQDEVFLHDICLCKGWNDPDYVRCLRWKEAKCGSFIGGWSQCESWKWKQGNSVAHDKRYEQCSSFPFRPFRYSGVVYRPNHWYKQKGVSYLFLFLLLERLRSHCINESCVSRMRWLHDDSVKPRRRYLRNWQWRKHSGPLRCVWQSAQSVSAPEATW